MPHITIATCAAHPEILPSDQVFAEALIHRGATVVGAPWNGPFEAFQNTDLVIVRSTWDYFEQLEAFYSWFDQLETTGVPVFNDLPTLRWNARKEYLFELKDKGAPVIPIIRVENQVSDIQAKAAAHSWQQIVVKCLVSGGARGMSLIDATNPEDVEQALETAKDYAPYGLMIQPFLPQIKTDGELSLIYLGGVFSHAVRKTPKPGEIRIQSEFGGRYQLVEVDAATKAAAAQCLAQAPTPTPLYARIDGLILAAGFQLMEMELTEPELMFTLAPDAAAKMAEYVLQDL